MSELHKESPKALQSPKNNEYFFDEFSINKGWKTEEYTFISNTKHDIVVVDSYDSNWNINHNSEFQVYFSSKKLKRDSIDCSIGLKLSKILGCLDHNHSCYDENKIVNNTTLSDKELGEFINEAYEQYEKKYP
jgi:hypothetical protein